MRMWSAVWPIWPQGRARHPRQMKELLPVAKRSCQRDMRRRRRGPGSGVRPRQVARDARRGFELGKARGENRILSFRAVAGKAL